MSQQSQITVVGPTPQRVLGVSNGPQRIQRPASHQKPVSHNSLTAKSTHHVDQNTNPEKHKGNLAAPQAKSGSQQNPSKMMNPEPTKTSTQSVKPENAQGNLSTKFFTLFNGLCSKCLKLYCFSQTNLQRMSLKIPVHQGMSFKCYSSFIYPLFSYHIY